MRDPFYVSFMSSDQGNFEFSNAFARRTDPDTSHIAANDVNGTKANQMEKVALSAFRKAADGLMNHELVAVTGIDWNTITPRVAPLRRKGFVVWKGTYRPGPSGKPCRVHYAV